MLLLDARLTLVVYLWSELPAPLCIFTGDMSRSREQKTLQIDMPPSILVWERFIDLNVVRRLMA